MNEHDTTQGDQYLSFILRDESFAVAIKKVREVLDVTTLTRIPRMPQYLCGVINLRGNVVPVVDLGMRLGMSPINNTVDSCIMIVEVSVEGVSEDVVMGVLGDAVQEVLTLGAESLEPAPTMGSGLNTEFIKAMAHYGDSFMVILDIDRVLGASATSDLQDVLALESLAKEELVTAVDDSTMK